ncbi:MAG: enoyl-CoA hydratase/isomerase family protein [Alphaproteobacteria bacterium]|nr:enoyl-CoA hydratase/isomerase family protein [Alphaproteobacteria bacterium]
MTEPGAGAIRLRRGAGAAGAVAHVTIDRPRKRNALGRILLQELRAVLQSLAGEPNLRAVVLAGAGRGFVGGADIDDMAGLDADSARAFITHVHGCCRALRELPVPVIARVHGFAFGAGLELAASCDLRVAAEDALFGMPEVRLGIPSVVEAALLPGLVGWGRAREILLLGETFSAAEAAAWGLVEQVVPETGLEAAVERWLAALLRNGPQAVRLQKRLIGDWQRLPLDAAIGAGVDAFAAAYATDEPQRLMAEFRAAKRARRS